MKSRGRGAGPAARMAALLLAAPLLPALATAWWHPRSPRAEARAADAAGIRQLDTNEAAALAGALWLDAREAADYTAGRVPGARPMRESAWDADFAGLMEAWDGVAPIIVYCGGASCRASEAVARRLRVELGVGEVLVLRGGWDAWRAAHGEVER